MIIVVCEQCGKEFRTHNSEIRRGGGRFCSRGCSTRHRNLTDNVSWREEVRAKISQNHADFSGERNPMYGKKGKDAPGYIDGRSKFKGPTHRKMVQAAGVPMKCVLCGSTEKVEVHHKDGNHFNNEKENLVVLCHSCHRNIAHTYHRDEKGRFARVETHDIYAEVMI